jgi:hypothetical protein
MISDLYHRYRFALVLQQVAAIIGKSSGNIRKARLYDVRWEGVPVKFRKYRDR